jgi:hypothetical protein
MSWTVYKSSADPLPATTQATPPAAAAYVYHLNGNLDNSGTAGAKGSLSDNGFSRFEPSPLGPGFGQVAVDSPKNGKNHVKVPLSTITDKDGSFTVEAVFEFPDSGPNSDPNQARFTIASYGGEEDGDSNTSGGGFYLNYNADPELASKIDATHPGSAARVQFVVDNRVRGTDRAFSRDVMVNALVPVTAMTGKAFRVCASWDNKTGHAVVGWSTIEPGIRCDSIPPARMVKKVTGHGGLAFNGTEYFLTVGGAEAEDGGNGFPAANVKIDDVKFVPGVDASAFTAAP